MDSSTTPTTIEVNGFAFREIRIRSGVDAGPCAAAAGIDRSYLSRLETGARMRVSPSTLAKLLEALQIKDRRAILANPHGQPGRPLDATTPSKNGPEIGSPLAPGIGSDVGAA